ncbi:hypothetical protein JCM21900_003146 [Sporobolomyces salmonicolor]
MFATTLVNTSPSRQILGAAARERSPSRQGRPRQVSPVVSYEPNLLPSSRTSTSSPVSEFNCSTPPEPASLQPAKLVRALESEPILYLPPLLSLLPASHSSSSPCTRAFQPNPGVEYTLSRLPTIDPLSLSLHSALHFFRPTTPLYAITPYASAFNWAELELRDLSERDLAREREWYIVAFRSKRRKGLKEEEARMLYEADRLAHEEAVMSGGLCAYWFGNCLSVDEAAGDNADLEGRNLATCLWMSRADAVAAMCGERHKEAARLASTTYESYTLERYILRKEPGERTVRVVPWQGREVVGAQ